ncbi:hypothetical protein SAMN05428963_10328 [Consotaella salsifontis]|uniref:Uncharacterized protein n=1 Tax=Consotaella salsifontis TaxID=1365950 RepID=A0A1T4NIN8_9HYPH|nr:hypothetical protein SAMN05428963_10328 [Consotaella salsifontis]
MSNDTVFWATSASGRCSAFPQRLELYRHRGPWSPGGRWRGVRAAGHPLSPFHATRMILVSSPSTPRRPGWGAQRLFSRGLKPASASGQVEKSRRSTATSASIGGLPKSCQSAYVQGFGRREAYESLRRTNPWDARGRSMRFSSDGCAGMNRADVWAALILTCGAVVVDRMPMPGKPEAAGRRRLRCRYRCAARG